MHSLGETINHDQNNRVVVVRGKSGDEIKGEVLPWAVRHWQGTQQPREFLCFIFRALTIKTRGNELRNITGKTRPVEVLGNPDNCFGNADMSSGWCGVVLLE